jgi:predicted transcriptional regulator of viral defense system
MALYTYQEALGKFGSRSNVLSRLADGRLFNLGRNLYSTEADPDPLALVMKRCPQSVVTGLTAFYIHGLTDKVPERIDLATRRNATRIKDPGVKQHFVSNGLFETGATALEHDGTKVRVYDLESMLFYLIHHDGTLPFDLFKEVAKSYRRRSGELDYRRLQEYAAVLPGGRRNLERIIKEIL